ncbi:MULTISPECIES: hypothetical protein [Microbispora]|uniref:DUF397 domain-containing protein n=1 Tax=Microbispora catharanthi TaxID=1712871 RepID=A0A5N6BTC5_9ACTN|nr:MULTISPECIES: hypothetical protein [Microbispora]KAB8183718.1 hypothetical protein FH610_018825 [Microbispora catharanthi]
MAGSERKFSHFANTRHRNWTIIGVADSPDDANVRSVEIFQGPDGNEPRLVLAPEEVPQFVAGLIATVMPGDLTAEAD